jgi:cytochrome c-type biogenesis protein CcmH/NrfG
MTLRAVSRMGELPMTAARALISALLLLCVAAGSQAALSAVAKPAAESLKRDFESCRAHANVDACYDAIRWNPSDPALLVALGDALERAKRPSDAIRAYRRAASLAPNTPGVAAKISAAEAKLSRKPASGSHSARQGTAGKRYSNAAPESQSH